MFNLGIDISIGGQMGAAGMALAAPVNTVLPVVTGALTVGSTLTSTQGTWTGTPPIAYFYQWKVAGINVGANQNTYVTVAGDATKTVTCTVIATNATASVPAQSAAVGPIV